MIVCSCNVLSDRDVRDRLVQACPAPRNVAEAYRCCGASPTCGRCAPSLRGIMRDLAERPTGQPAEEAAHGGQAQAA
jgi:bacterioferritin-associated ferredoxin